MEILSTDSRYQVIEDESGVYKGDVLNKERDGIGMMYYIGGDIYGGQWQKNNSHGIGMRITNSGRYYGNFTAGFKNGYGIYYY